MCEYFCIEFIEFIYFIYFIYDLEDKNLLEYSNLFSSNEYEKNDKIILKYFQ